MKSTKKYTLPVLLILLIIPAVSMGQSSNVIFNDIETDADVTTRFEHKNTHYAMTTREGAVDLMIVENGIAIQFSNTFFDELDHEIMEENADENAFATAFKTAVSSGVSSLLDRALVIPNHEIAEASYSNGWLYIINHQKEDIFENLDINDIPVMEDFAPRKAKRFATLLNRQFP